MGSIIALLLGTSGEAMGSSQEVGDISADIYSDFMASFLRGTLMRRAFGREIPLETKWVRASMGRTRGVSFQLGLGSEG
jgi:hypothetical protein